MGSQNSLGYGDQSFQSVGNVKAVDALELIVVSTTSNTAVTAVGQATITVASIANIVVDQTLYIDTGTNFEAVTVTAVSGSTFTAYFLKIHSGTYAVSLKVLRQTVIISDPVNLTAIANVTTKGTQATYASACQDFKDTGRTSIALIADKVMIGVTAETLVTFTPTAGLVAGTAATSYTVSAGKTFRLQTVFISVYATSANVQTTVRMRAAPSGAATLTSALIASILTLSTTSSVTSGSYILEVPDGIEFPAGSSMAFSRQDTSASALYLSITAVGFEY